jgi:hypothetical protein
MGPWMRGATTDRLSLFFTSDLTTGAPMPQQHMPHPQHPRAAKNAYKSMAHVCWHLSGPGFVEPSSVGPSAPTTQASYLPQHPPQKQQHATQQTASTRTNALHPLNTVQQSTSPSSRFETATGTVMDVGATWLTDMSYVSRV